MSELRIEPLRRRHVAAVARIERQVSANPWSADLFRGELALPEASRCYRIARRGGRVIAFGGLMFVLDEAHVTTLAVQPDHQGARIGTRLLLVLVREAVARGTTALTLEVRMGNEPARALYQRFGFVPAGIRKNYYAEVGEDALIMWAHEVDGAGYGERLDAIESDLPPAEVRGGMSTVATNDLVLGIETSCDETAAAVVAGGTDVRSSIVSSQIDLHAEFGGVVPEIAGRAHVELLVPVVADALVEAGVVGADIGAVAATVGPGLVGALLVGVSAAKALALVWEVPFVAVNHLEAHLYAALLEEPDLELPLVFLLVSGGHTLLVVMEGHGRYRVLGSTVDDAAGEAFDKVARYLGLGYPGGPIIDRLAQDGDATAIAFPRAMPGDNLDFSFSGLKTAVVNHVRKHPDVAAEDVAASFQEAVVDVLVAKARKAADAVGAKGLALGGGVAANSRLREAFLAAAAEDGRPGYVPSRAMCTDNAAMVASCGWYRWQADGGSPLDLGADPGLRLG